ncbi:beta-1,4-galactosyltransferase 1-like isoform X2 [Kryptolebias marmoratus]|uniref:beta-1,4-galactosyltransferase 1-like isoform X2 n=1 Tax=Kryptolebias marmoratus TaxID=37003 RepID=UPI0018ACA56F|nr:beta-1,4-galactosyltransferase 1-like isoform X2 [Kryptolebias marmoratus]
MMKILLTLLTLFVFLSLIVFSLFLYEKNGFLKYSRSVKNANKTSFWNDKNNVAEIKENQRTTSGNFSWKLGGTFQKAKMTEKKNLTSPGSEKTLESCPETPPTLVGPLAVEFKKQTLEEVREKVGSPLQEGGRYKPPGCISRQKVAIIIPFRNRHEHLIHLLFYLHPILIRQQLDYGVYVINQDGDGVFNRAKLLNAGYMEALKDYDYECFVFSDVDLVPLDDRNLYRCFNQPRHLAVGMDKFNFHLPYTTFFGGVSSLSKEQFLKAKALYN